MVKLLGRDWSLVVGPRLRSVVAEGSEANRRLPQLGVAGILERQVATISASCLAIEMAELASLERRSGKLETGFPGILDISIHPALATDM